MVTKDIKLQTKTDKPDNVLLKEHEIVKKCKSYESQLPNYLRGFFTYLKGNVLPMSRMAYLHDIIFFFNYLISETDLTAADDIKNITLEELNGVKAVDINIYIEYCRHYEVEKKNSIYVYENCNKTLARKKSSVSIMFKQLYRDELLEKNITDGFDPIRVPKTSERVIKTLEDDEVMIMLDAVSNGTGLTEKEKQYWEKTKKRDKAVLIIFVTYGLRLSELQQLNVSSFNFKRGEFTIYRKRDKESVMPLNKSVKAVIEDYIYNEREEILNKKDITDEDALFLSLRGTRLTDRQIRQLVKKYTSIGLATSREKGYSPHKLRATTATSLIAKGNSIFDVQALLDHESVTTTQLYASHKKNVKRDLVQDMEWEEERLAGLNLEGVDIDGKEDL